MLRWVPALGAAAGAAFLMAPAPQRHMVRLPPGVIAVRAEMLVEGGTDLGGDASGTVLRAAPGFVGRAVIVVRGGNVRLHDLTIDGDREAIEVPQELPPYDTPFARFTRGNGVLAEDLAGLKIENVRFRNIAGFAALASHAHDVSIDRVEVEDSGSRNFAGRNNTTGGILLEEGTTDFRVMRPILRNIRGNGIWTHSLYRSPRNARGIIVLGAFENIGRDAIQVGHASAIRVEENSGTRIGFPADDVDVEGRAIPVAIDTAGNVDGSSYVNNRFREINGKCIDLDGFHDGEVRGNQCAGSGNYAIVMNNTNWDMQSRNIRVVDNEISGALFGGIFVIGTGHLIARNRLLNLNTAHCNEEAARSGCYYAPGEPDMLQSGIYLGRGAERPAPAWGNRIEENEITGFKMDTRCIGRAPATQPDWNTVRNNRCR